MTRKILTTLLVLVLVISAAGCARQSAPAPAGPQPDGPATPKQGGTLVVALPGNPATFNPNAKPDDNGIFISQNVFNKLVTLDNDYNVIPDLAKSWEISGDGKVYTFNLVTAKWHDGTPFSSADVKWTLEAIVKNKALASGTLAAIDKIDTPAPDKVIITLKEPNPPFLTFLGWFGTYIMPKHLYESSPDWLVNPANEKPVGTGPFKLESFKNDDHVTLVANKEYFGGTPYLDKIIFRVLPDENTAVQAFLNKEVDISLTRPPLSQVPTLEKTPGVKLDIYPMPNRYYVPMNLTREYFRKAEVRQALGMAINREEVLAKALKGVGRTAEGYYTPAIAWAYNANLKSPPFDPKKAEQLLDAAGYPRGADGIRMKLVLPHFQATEWGDIAAVIKENLKSVGIDVQIVQLEMGAWVDRVLVKKDFDITLMGGQQGPDPDALRMRFGTGGALNMMGYSSAELDEVLAAGASAPTKEARVAAYMKAQEILAKDQPFVPVAEMVAMVLYRDTVKGLFHLPEMKGKVPQWGFSQTWLDK